MLMWKLPEYQLGAVSGMRPWATRSPQILAQRSASSKMIAQGRYLEKMSSPSSNCSWFASAVAR